MFHLFYKYQHSDPYFTVDLQFKNAWLQWTLDTYQIVNHFSHWANLTRCKSKKHKAWNHLLFARGVQDKERKSDQALQVSVIPWKWLTKGVFRPMSSNHSDWQSEFSGQHHPIKVKKGVFRPASSKVTDKGSFQASVIQSDWQREFSGQCHPKWLTKGVFRPASSKVTDKGSFQANVIQSKWLKREFSGQCHPKWLTKGVFRPAWSKVTDKGRFQASVIQSKWLTKRSFQANVIQSKWLTKGVFRPVS